MGKNINLQEDFLNHLLKGHRPATIITVNGFQLKGRIVGHDQYTLLVESDGQQQLVYKSAVSTIKAG